MLCKIYYLYWSNCNILLLDTGTVSKAGGTDQPHIYATAGPARCAVWCGSLGRRLFPFADAVPGFPLLLSQREGPKPRPLSVQASQRTCRAGCEDGTRNLPPSHSRGSRPGLPPRRPVRPAENFLIPRGQSHPRSSDGRWLGRERCFLPNQGRPVASAP